MRQGHGQAIVEWVVTVAVIVAVWVFVPVAA